MVEKLVPGLFLKNWNCPYHWVNGLKFYTVCFYFMTSWGLSKYIETKLQTTCFHLILSFFKKIRRGLELVPRLIVRIIFVEKYFLSIDEISLSGCLYFVRHLAICVLQLFVNQVGLHELWSYTYLSNQAIFPTWPKSRDKNLDILRTKRAFKMK